MTVTAPAAAHPHPDEVFPQCPDGVQEAFGSDPQPFWRSVKPCLDVSTQKRSALVALERVPVDILSHILSYLPFEYLTRASGVSRVWLEASSMRNTCTTLEISHDTFCKLLSTMAEDERRLTAVRISSLGHIRLSGEDCLYGQTNSIVRQAELFFNSLNRLSQVVVGSSMPLQGPVFSNLMTRNALTLRTVDITTTCSCGKVILPPLAMPVLETLMLIKCDCQVEIEDGFSCPAIKCLGIRNPRGRFSLSPTWCRALGSIDGLLTLSIRTDYLDMTEECDFGEQVIKATERGLKRLNTVKLLGLAATAAAVDALIHFVETGKLPHLHRIAMNSADPDVKARIAESGFLLKEKAGQVETAFERPASSTDATRSGETVIAKRRANPSSE